RRARKAADISRRPPGRSAAPRTPYRRAKQHRAARRSKAVPRESPTDPTTVPDRQRSETQFAALSKILGRLADQREFTVQLAFILQELERLRGAPPGRARGEPRQNLLQAVEFQQLFGGSRHENPFEILALFLLPAGRSPRAFDHRFADGI